MERMIDTISRRKSVRTFSPELLRSDHKDTIAHAISVSNEARAPFGTISRIIDIDTAGDDPPRRIGTYGVIKRPKGYLVGICKDCREAAIDLGYRMEGIILTMTGMGVGTCWLGGTFNKTHIRDMVELEEDEVVAAVIPYGYPADGNRLMEGLMKRAAGSSQRKPLNELFDCTGVMNEGLMECLEAVRLAPSSMNNQPWRGRVDSDRVHLCMKLPKKTGGEVMRMRHLDMGIAMQHLEAVCIQNIGEAVWTRVEGSSPVNDPELGYIATLVFKCSESNDPSQPVH